MDAALHEALLVVDALATQQEDGAERAAAAAAATTDSQARTHYDSVGADKDLANELEALSLYERHLREYRDDDDDDDEDDKEKALATVTTATGNGHTGAPTPTTRTAHLTQRAAEATLAALDGGFAPMLPTTHAKQQLQSKNKARRARREQLKKQQANSSSSKEGAPPAAAEEEEQEKRFTAAPGYGDAVGPLQFMVDAKSGDVAMTRAPLSTQEWTVTLNAMANDLNTRLLCDPMWVEQARPLFQQLSEIGQQTQRVRRLAEAAPPHDERIKAMLIKQEGEQAQQFVQLQRSFYEFVSKYHQPLLMTSYRLALAEMVMGSSCHPNFKPHVIMPVGCGESHAALLCSTERHPKRYHLLFAWLLCPDIVTLDDVNKVDGLLAGPTRARTACWPRYQMATGFRLTPANSDVADVEVLHVSIHRHHVLVAFCPAGEIALHVGIHSLVAPSQPTTVLRFDNVVATSEWRVASDGRFVALAFNDGQSYRFARTVRTPSDTNPAETIVKKEIYERHSPNKIHVWSIVTPNKPRFCFPLDFEAAPSDGADGCEHFAPEQPAVITAMCFDVNPSRPSYLCVSTYDRRALTLQLEEPSADEDVHYAARAYARIGATFQQCSVAPTKEQELAFAELSRQRSTNSAREPPTWIHTNYGFETRLVVLSPNNFLLKTLCGFGRQPTITEHLASYDGLQLGTLPLVYQHGAGHVQSVATAGNLLVVHFAQENDVVMINMRDQNQLQMIKGSALLGYAPPEHESEADAADAATTPTKKKDDDDEDPFRPTYYYQSTWASLARIVVLLPNGAMIICEPKFEQQNKKVSLTPSQMAGEMFAASRPAAAAAASSPQQQQDDMDSMYP